MDFRKVFDGIVDEFDRWRPRYCDEAFEDIIRHAQLGPDKSVLEIGPGTGQATEPLLKTGCSYLAIELGENLAEFTKNKFASYENFQIVNGDFETYDLGRDRFDLVFSAATIQWIPEEIAFPKAYDILKSGGTFAMMLMPSDYKSPNEALYNEIQKVYDRHFQTQTPYTCQMDYSNRKNYGFTGLQCLQYKKTRVLTADEYVAWTGTHADHITLQEPHKSQFYAGLRDAVLRFGDRIEFWDTIILYLAKKP